MELEFIRWLEQRIPPDDRVLCQLGDDAAVLQSDPRHHVVASDMLMEGVHFEWQSCTPRLVGRKALAVNLSDLAAMAAEPVYAIVSLALPQNPPGGRDTQGFAKELIEGLLELAEVHRVALIGGDTNCWAGPLVINVSVGGATASTDAWTRSGARVGDSILASGQFGGSLLGRHLTFEPQVELALQLAQHYQVHAATDVSDGLGVDLWHICRASDVGAVLHQDAIPIHPDAVTLSKSDGITALDHGLHDGEDFELLLTAAPDESLRMLESHGNLTKIGEIVANEGIYLQGSGKRTPLSPRGFEHG